MAGHPGDERPFVFLHEGLGSVSHWRDFPDELCAATGRMGVVYSRVGYGASSPVVLPRPLDYFFSEGERMLPGLLDALDLQDVVLFGHSDGASIAVVAAAGEPRVRGLVLESPHVFTEPSGLDAIRQAAEAFAAGELRQRLERHHRDVDGAFCGWAGAWLNPEFLQPDLVPTLGGVGCPTLVIQGTADPYGTLSHAEAIARHGAGPVSFCILDDVGHSPHREAPEAVIAAVVAFLARHEL